MYKLNRTDANRLRDFMNNEHQGSTLVKGTEPKTASVVWLRFDRDATGGFNVKVDAELEGGCSCGHPQHAGQCPAPDGCWCDDFSKEV